MKLLKEYINLMMDILVLVFADGGDNSKYGTVYCVRCYVREECHFLCLFVISSLYIQYDYLLRNTGVEVKCFSTIAGSHVLAGSLLHTGCAPGTIFTGVNLRVNSVR